MKLVSILISLLLIALIVMPCMDKISGDSGNGSTYLYQQNEQNHKDPHSADDFCSPLCACNCCHVTSAFFRTTSAKFLRVTDSEIHSTDQNSIPKSSLQAIWRPPKQING